MEEEKNLMLGPNEEQEEVINRDAPLLGASNDMFSVTSDILNKLDTDLTEDVTIKFPGNISPEGYFYSPFYEVTLKELDDEIQSINVKRINFKPSEATMEKINVTSYNPETGSEGKKDLYLIKIKSPIPYDIIMYQPFAVYDVSEDETKRGYLYDMNNADLVVATEYEIVEGDLKKGRYIISLIEENAPDYAEFIPSSQKLVWRGPKKMSELSSDSPIYNMPFTNGRLYVHKNLDIFVRRQDPHNDFKLFRPTLNNPLRRFQVEGNPKLDFDQIQTIIDSMVDAC